MEIPKETYEPDIALLDRYQGFSAELVRLSVAGIGLAGFFLSSSTQPRSLFSAAAGAFAAGAFAISASLALGHRYFSTDGMHYHLLSRRVEGNERERAERARNAQYRISGKLLGAAAIAGAIGALASAAALVGVVIHTK